MEPVIGQAMFESVHILTTLATTCWKNALTASLLTKKCRRLRLQLYRYRYLPEPVHRSHNGDIVGKICAETGKSVREAFWNAVC